MTDSLEPPPFDSSDSGDEDQPPAEQDRFTEGTYLGRYRITSLIGKGGMGEVYRAGDTELGREVALKVIRQLSYSERRLARFHQEARAIAALSHPNILSIYDVGTDGGVAFTVTELLSGETLGKRLLGGALPPSVALRYGLQIAAGLEAAHGKGIVHRDLKPENIFITDDDMVKILDFGVAKYSSPSTTDTNEQETRSKQTVPGAIIGTIGYMAPEQLRGETVDARADLFAFGALMFEMLTGKPAFGRPSAAESMAAILKEETPTLKRVRPPLPLELQEAIGRCLEKDRENRFSSASDLLSALSLDTEREIDTRESLGRGSSEEQDPASIAVLPFVDLSADKNQEYFCEGIAEEVLNALTKNESLKVAGRTSASKFKDQNEDIRRIGRELRVKTILDGSVRAAGTRLRITAKLISTRDGFQIWSERYDRELDDIFAIQDDIAEKIVAALQPHLTNKKDPNPARRTDLKAYRAYLKARYQLNRRTKDALQKSIEYAKEAIAIDEEYAPAYACLADGLFLLSFQGATSPTKSMPEAKAAAERALTLDEGLGEAHASLGAILATYDWDWERSALAFRRAISLNPGSANAHYWFAIWHLIPTGQFEEAEREIKIALELDPLSLVVNTGLAWFHLFAGQPGRALEEVRHSLKMDSEFPMAHDVAAQALTQLGRHADAVAEANQAIELTKGRSLSLAALGHALALQGENERAKDILRQLHELRDDRYASSYDLALVYTGLDNYEEAIAWLEHAVDEKNGWSVFLAVEPRFDELRSDARLVSLTRRLGISS